MALDKFIPNPQKGSKIDIRKDLEELFSGFEWKAMGIANTDGQIYPIPKIPQVVTGIIESLGKIRIHQLAKTKYKCQVIEGGSREYPDITLCGGAFGSRMIAVEIKTARRDSKRKDRTSRMSLGSCAGYFLHPDRKMAGCRFPYGLYYEHWIVGCIYDWDENAPSESMVSNIEVIVHPKWRIASRSTATGDTAAMGSIIDINELRAGRGEFETEKAFEDYWRGRGKGYKR